VGQLADAIGVPAGEVLERLRSLRDRLAAARSAATLNGSLDDEDKRRHGEFQEAQAKLKATEEALAPLLAETGSADRVALGAAIERSRAKRGLADEIAATERAILEAGDGLELDELLAAVGAADPDQVAAQLGRSAPGSKSLTPRSTRLLPRMAMHGRRSPPSIRMGPPRYTQPPTPSRPVPSWRC
jgi:hypothetical protein